MKPGLELFFSGQEALIHTLAHSYEFCSKIFEREGGCSRVFCFHDIQNL
jgi:hypothetical protein